MAKLAKILKTDVMGDLSALAQILQSKGRGKDTILAHITPAEAKRLKKAGGRGSRNPDTGLLEFEEAPAPSGTIADITVSTPADTGGGSSYAGSGYQAPVTDAAASSGGDYAGTPAAGVGAQAEVPTAQMPPAAADTGLTPTAPGLLAQPSQDAMSDLYKDIGVKEPQQGQNFLQKYLGKLGPQDLARLGIAGVGGLAGLVQSRKAAKQIGAAQQEQQALATPYQEQGRALTQAAAAGQLSPASAQAYQAAQAQMQQQAAQRGGVGVEQQAAQLEGFRQQLLAQQYTYGLQVAQIGDNIALGAIRTGLQLDAQLQQASQGFYTSLAAIAAGVPLKAG